MAKKRALTYKDIAKRSGVSVTTVSRVVNKKDLHKINKETQQKVQKIIDKLNFSPNIIARSLASRKTFNIAVALKDLEDIINPYFNQVISGIAGILQNEGYYLELVRTTSTKKQPLSPYYINAVGEKRVDGAIILSEEAKTKDLIQLHKQKFPLVLVNRYIKGKNIPSILINNKKGLYEATKELIKLGHKKIVFMAGSLSFQLDRNRLNGYKQALSENNIEFDKDLILEGWFDFDKTAVALDELLNKKIEFSGIVASDDVMALSCINKLEENGFYMPEDFSVIGFNDMLPMPVASTLSSMRLPLVKIGEEAAKMLIKIINKQRLKKKTITFAPKLIRRESITSNNPE